MSNIIDDYDVYANSSVEPSEEDFIDACYDEALKQQSNQYKTILELAYDVVESRKNDYGNVLDSFTKIARLWGDYLDIEVNPNDVAHMMIILKIVRNENGFKLDNLVDIAGYSHCMELMQLYRIKSDSVE